MKRYIIGVLLCYCTVASTAETFPHRNDTLCQVIAHLMSTQRQYRPQQHPLSSITGYTHHDHTIHESPYISREVAERIAHDFGIFPLHNAYSEHMCTGISGIATAIESAIHDYNEHHNTRMYVRRFVRRQQRNYDQCLYTHAQQYTTFSDAQKACLNNVSRLYPGTTIYAAIQQEAAYYSDNI